MPIRPKTLTSAPLARNTPTPHGYDGGFYYLRTGFEWEDGTIMDRQSNRGVPATEAPASKTALPFGGFTMQNSELVRTKIDG